MSLQRFSVADFCHHITEGQSWPKKICELAREWGGYFQSPIDKSASTLDQSFEFDHRGVLKQPTDVAAELATWLRKAGISESVRTALSCWISESTLPDADSQLAVQVAPALRRHALLEETLYNRSICRLVRRDQLRFDPDYQAVYQVTPGQSRLTQHHANTDLLRLQHNQRSYWGLSASLQSLLAMFDSDLGRDIDSTELNEQLYEETATPSTPSMTKELLRYVTEDSATALARLNHFSPLRYWSPPAAFCKNVLHMLLWRSLITGRDLYNRPIPPYPAQDFEPPDLAARRAAHYYVIVNRFNTGRYRIADYANLFELLMKLAQAISAWGRPTEEIRSLKDLALTPPPTQHDPSDDPGFAFYPTTDFRQSRLTRGTLMIPGESLGDQGITQWELANPSSTAPTTVGDVLSFLRDRTVELILWRHYQMEIRSVGAVPIRELYAVQLSQSGQEEIAQLITSYRKGQESYTDINKRVRQAVENGTATKWIHLVRVYGGPNRHLDIPTGKYQRLFQFRRRDRRVGDRRTKIRRGENEKPDVELRKRMVELRKRMKDRRRSVDRRQKPRRIQKIVSNDQETTSTWKAEEPENVEIFGKLAPLACLRNMIWYYEQVDACITQVAAEKDGWQRWSRKEATDIRRYVNTDLLNFGLEFYLQRISWAERCKNEPHTCEAKAAGNPSIHPCHMSGFERVVTRDPDSYSYEMFMGETLSIFEAMHAHLTAINHGLGELYYNVTSLPFGGFTPAGKAEVGQLAVDLRTIMRDLIVATHLQPLEPTIDADVISHLASSRTRCQRMLDMTDRYYHIHRLRLIVFPIDPIAPHPGAVDPTGPHVFPTACLPWSAGVYFDLLRTFENLARHVQAVVHWALRLYSRWYFVPRRYLRIIGPASKD